jgi:hypothetical protein
MYKCNAREIHYASLQKQSGRRVGVGSGGGPAGDGVGWELSLPPVPSLLLRPGKGTQHHDYVVADKPNNLGGPLGEKGLTRLAVQPGPLFLNPETCISRGSRS